jgi:hypothetical protein
VQDWFGGRQKMVVVVVVVPGVPVVVVVVVVGAWVVVVVPGPTMVPVQFPGGMQRELPLPKTQQTQPGAQATVTVRVPGL